MRQIALDFEEAGIPIQLAEDLLHARPSKTGLEYPLQWVSVVLDASTDELMADEYTKALVEQLMGEVIAGAASRDRHIPDSFIAKMLDYTINMQPYRTSMKIDYDQRL